MNKRKVLNFLSYITNAVVSIVLSAILFSAFFLSQPERITAHAQSTTLDSTSVESDITAEQMAQIKTEYVLCDKSKLYVVSFVEYCFSYDVAYSGNFGMYVYVYNPSAKEVVEDSLLHKISLRVNDENGRMSYKKYTLSHCSTSKDGNFIKFKITDKKFSDRATIVEQLYENRLQRIYDVSEIEVCHKSGNNAVSYTVGKKYIYTGFTAGYGKDSSVASTIDCYVENLSIIADRKVHHTSYCPEGTNGADDTQDLLASVYFTLPNKITDEKGNQVNVAEKYGNLYGIHAQWLEALTKPMLVTGTEEVYKKFLPYIGEEIGSYSYDINYGFATNFERHSYGQGAVQYTGDNLYNIAGTLKTSYIDTGNYFSGERLNALYWLFSTKVFGDNAADKYTLISEELQAYAKDYSNTHDNWITGTNYSCDLFERWDNSFTEVTYYAGDTKSLTSKTFEGFLGFFGVPTTQTYNIPVIQKVTECTNALQVENDYYVNQEDFEEFKKAFNEKDTTLYVFHFAVDDYYSAEATQFYSEKGLFGDYYQYELDTNAFLAQETVYLNFDVIDITLMDDNGTQTVLGVVSSPIDIFPDALPPVDTTTDFNFADFFAAIIRLLGLLLLVFLVVAFWNPLMSLLKIIWEIITVPFKALWELLNKRKE